MQAPMRLMAERMLRDNDAAADAVQEAFVQLWERRKRLDSIDNLEGYCLQTVRYRCVDVMRKRLPVVPIESAGEITDEEVLAESQMIEERSLRVEQLMSELNERRRDKQPLEYPSAGSTFKRPEGYFAGKLIQDCGLKGYTVGGAQVSVKHSGFVINTGNATATDIFSLISDVQAKVYEKFGVHLETEVCILK